VERKEAFGKTVRSSRDYDLPWGGERLQARGKIRRFPNDPLFLRGAFADEIADHH
jgi:hypothetical protein